MSRLSRFLHLERPRSPADSSATPAASREARFGALEADAKAPAAPPAASAPGHLARFDDARNDPSRFDPAAVAPVELDAQREVEQPYARCRACEGDNTRYARVCAHCRADLDTPEQRAFNAQLWEAQRAHRDAEREASARAQEALLEAAREEKLAQRAHYEELARQVKRETEARLGGSPAPVEWSPRALAMFAGAGLVLLAAFLLGGTRAAVRLAVLALVVAALVLRQRRPPRD